MIKFAMRGLLARKFRTVLTALGVVLGVALVSGTYVLTDSISTAFDSIFEETYRNADAAITGKSAFSLGGDSSSLPPSFHESLLKTVAALPGVRSAGGSVNGEAHLIGDDGKSIVFGGAPNLGFSVDPALPQFNALTLVAGSWPHAGEVVVDKSTAGKKDLSVGQRIGVQARGPVVTLRISGIVEFGAVASIGGATIAGFDLPTAQRLFDKRGELDQILLAGQPGVTPEQLVASVRKVLPPGTQVRTASQQASKAASDTTGFISFLQTFLLAFGGIALFVGSFVIANSLSITIAQRSREFATLRTLGASRRQVLGSVILEALAVGAAAAVTGLFLGLALAKGLFKLFDAVGFTLPNNGLVFQTRTIVAALLVGTLVTLLASLRPAIRATRVPPIAAVREGAKLPPGRFHRFRGVGAALVIAIGFAALLVGLFVNGLGTSRVLTFMLVGALLLFIGVAIFSSRVVRPLAAAANPVARWSVVALSAIMWPLFSLPFWLLRYAVWGPAPGARRVGAFVLGSVLNPVLLLVVALMALRRRLTAWRPEWPAEFPGVLAERSATRIGGENSRRDPHRTAATAAALMIGLALVTLVAALAAGIIKPFEDAVDEIFTGDYAITAQNNFDPIPISAAAAAAKTPGVESIASVRTGDGRVFNKTVQITAVDPQAPDVLSLDWQHGSQAVLGQLGTDGAVVSDGYADDHNLRIGSPLQLRTPTGSTVDLRIAGIYKPPPGGSPFGTVTMSSATFDKNYQQPRNLYTFVRMRGGVTDANTAALQASLESFPNAKAVTRQQFKDNQVNGIKTILNILYVLLALSVVVSIIGIVNTLVLTVFERTRELGMLRAIGMTRRQTRRMIRHESVVTALIGAALGIVLGLVLAGLLCARLDFIEFVLPIPQLITFAVVAVVVGVLAAVLPARHAARLDPLQALQYE
ncbi:MAG TPA: FtsX-like permease family protein [Jatrophihabitans sp.]|jgi:ABC-type antimicrobial peptide transport system permease subunit|nr:FtsX-like permease family protein [Jatrophihabitans sp.]